MGIMDIMDKICASCGKACGGPGTSMCDNDCGRFYCEACIDVDDGHSCGSSEAGDDITSSRPQQPAPRG